MISINPSEIGVINQLVGCLKQHPLRLGQVAHIATCPCRTCASGAATGTRCRGQPGERYEALGVMVVYAWKSKIVITLIFIEEDENMIQSRFRYLMILLIFDNHLE